MKKKISHKALFVISVIFALIAAALYFISVYAACVYGSNYFIAEKIGGGYMAFMLFSVVFLLAEYIYFGRNDNARMVTVRFIVHNIFGGIGLLLCRVVYAATDMEKQCILSPNSALKNVFFGKWVSYAIITLVAAVFCYLLGSDEKSVRKRKK